MLSSIYKSPRKHETYLFVEKAGDFSRVPESLLETFGKPELVMTLALSERKQLAGADLDKVKADLQEKGYYLQLPKPDENMLEVHKAMQKADEALEQQNAAEAAKEQQKH